MPSFHQGSTALQQQHSVTSWTPDQGWVTTITWEGSKVDCQNKAELEAVWSEEATSIVITPRSNNTHRLTIQYADHDNSPTQNNPDDTSVWELTTNELQESIWEHPVYANTANVTLADIRSIQTALSTNPISDFTTSGARPKADELYKYLLRGTEFYQSSQPVIKQTISRHRNNENFNVNYSNSNRVVTLASIGAPSTILGALNDLPFPNSTGGVSTGSYEWLKKTPRTRITNRYLVTVSYEWWGVRQWSQTLYGGTFTP